MLKNENLEQNIERDEKMKHIYDVLRLPSKEEALNMLAKDELLKQIVRVIKQVHPGIRIYTDKYEEETCLNIYPETLSHEQCTDIGKMIRSDYSYETAGDDVDYPFFIDVLAKTSIPHLVDITDLA